jgi:hypothetical protein
MPSLGDDSKSYGDFHTASGCAAASDFLAELGETDGVAQGFQKEVTSDQ